MAKVEHLPLAVILLDHDARSLRVDRDDHRGRAIEAVRAVVVAGELHPVSFAKLLLHHNYAKSFDSWKNNPASPVGSAGNRFSPGDARANAFVHEGTHVKQFERGMTLDQYNNNPTPFEREAYRAGNSINEAFGTVSPFPEP